MANAFFAYVALSLPNYVAQNLYLRAVMVPSAPVQAPSVAMYDLVTSLFLFFSFAYCLQPVTERSYLLKEPVSTSTEC
jgi:hypothetical protein